MKAPAVLCLVACATLAATAAHALPSGLQHVDPKAPCYRWPAVDMDRDGVFDRVDHCVSTPPGCVVDAYGCSLDGDGDGVCDGVRIGMTLQPERRGDVHTAEDEASAHAEIDKLGEEADRALAALGAEEAGEGPGLPGGALGDEPPAAAPPPAAGSDVRRLRDRVSELLIELAHAQDRAKGHEAELQTARAEAEREARGRRDAEERLRRAEESLRQLEEQARDASQRAAHLEEQDRGASQRAGQLEEQLAALRLQVEETAQTASLKAAQIAALESEASGLRSQVDAAHADLEAARASLEGTREDAERRVADAQKRLQELEAVNAKHEERIVKAYQKIKSDEKIREKTRKALAIALQLLDERIAAAPPKEPGEPVPRRE